MKAMGIWRKSRQTARRVDAPLLFNPDGTFQVETVQRLVHLRDQRPIRLYE
jgi:hypothetical protein